MELIRKILLYIEEHEQPMSSRMMGIKIDGFTCQLIDVHLRLMDRKGFFEIFSENLSGGFTVNGLTNEAYDYLELIRNEEVWEKTNNVLEEKKLPKTMENIAKVAGTLIGAIIDQIK